MDYMADAPFVPAQLHLSVTLKRESKKINGWVLCFPVKSSFPKPEAAINALRKTQ